jgi:AraC-like DNA-binding protein
LPVHQADKTHVVQSPFGIQAFGPAVIAFQPRMSLRDRISAIMVVEDADTERTVLPTAGAVLGIQTSGRVRAETGLLTIAGVTGVQNVARTYTYVGRTSSLLVRFTPQGAACLGLPASELASRSIGLHEILRADRVDRMHEAVIAARTPADRVAVLEDFVAQLPFTGDSLVAEALKLVASSSTRAIRIAEVARLLGLSERQLERRFLERVGVTPKRFAMLRRFERAIASARTTPSLTAVALDAGYYDQSHFVREFRQFTGVSPGALLRTPRQDVGFVQSPALRRRQYRERRRT